MTADVINLSAFRSRRAEQAAAHVAAKAACIAKPQPQARASSRAPLEPVAPHIEEPSETEPVEAEPEPIRWQTSSRGNPWTQIGDLHIVIFPDRGNTDEWLVRVQRGESQGRYLKHVWPSAEVAQEAVERALRGIAAKSPAALLSNLS